MDSKHVRWIALLLILGIASCLIKYQSVSARVDESHGLAPALPPDTPGINRPFPQDREKFTFAIIGDKTGGGERNWPIFDRAMDEVSHLHPDFAIMLGDLIQGYTDDTEVIHKQWKEFHQHANRIQVPLFFLPGNHDISNKAMYEYWKANIGRTYYSFDYGSCHFMLLNTEEGWRTDEIGFGTEQMEWARQDIISHQDSRHIFLFMHRPPWRYVGNPALKDAVAQWEMIESWLEGLPYTVFVGHFHSLAYEKRNDRPYYILGATGGKLFAPSDFLALGGFHHYTLITVDRDDTHISVVEPGSVYPHDIAPRKFSDKVSQILTWEKHLPVAKEICEGELIASVNNILDKPVTIDFEYSPSDGSSWNSALMSATYVVQPGDTAEFVLKAQCDFENLLPLPSYKYSISYEGKQLLQEVEKLEPELTAIGKWMVVGPFGMATQEQVSDESDTASSAYDQTLEPERNWDINAKYLSGSDTVGWQEAETGEDGWVNFGNIYDGDDAIAYGLCYIQVPDDRQVVAYLDCYYLTKVLVDGEEVHSVERYDDPRYFMLTLAEGWNTVVVKCTQHERGWRYTLRVADPNKELTFTNSRPR